MAELRAVQELGVGETVADLVATSQRGDLSKVPRLVGLVVNWIIFEQQSGYGFSEFIPGHLKRDKDAAC